ncbi:CAF17-like 4Fe-4S cluster assembly/insertion protein YgfZ [Methylotetracoccus oryzae]|uniref:CAF17-like 4Fe-4S cluster assembly/insertion protein YgfZ n=1 Tax=Methylotetracoccus oryzae TaxID=1919059 RepID=UPI001118030E|nr:folate-binding protein YgfZ [Methylotetracoccus oryzae]
MHAHDSGSPAVFELATLDDHAVLAIEGADAVGFLQGQTTCDIKALKPGQMTLGAICNPKGRTLAVFRLLRVESGCLLVLPKDRIDAVRRRLIPYVLRAQIRITGDVDDGEWSLLGGLGSIGPGAGAVLGMTGEPQPGQALLMSTGAWVLALERSGKYLVAGPSAVTAALRDQLLADGLAHEITNERWQFAEIADGIPTITDATAEEFIPQMLNLDLLGGISFSKGCYTGQEVVARTHYLGAVKRRMHRLRAQSDRRPEAGLRIAMGPDDTLAGQVLIAAGTPEMPGCYDMLSVLTAEGAQAQELRLGSPSGPRLEPARLPYSLET